MKTCENKNREKKYVAAFFFTICLILKQKVAITLLCANY